MQPDFDLSLDFDELDAMLEAERTRQNNETKLKIVQYTDPLCGWCYGMEPVMTKIRFLLGDRLDFSYVMGLMIPSSADILGTGFEAKQRFDAMKQQLVYGYMMIENTTNMPMVVGRIDKMQIEDITSLESSLGYEAIKIVDGPERAIAFMRMLRQAVYAFETSIGSRESVAFLANLFGTDMRAYDAAIESGDAKRLLDDEVQACRALGIEGFPTLQISYGERNVFLGGYQRIDTLANAISYLSGGAIELSHAEYSERRVMELLDEFDQIAAEELRMVFDLAPEGAKMLVDELEKKGLIEVIPTGNSFFIKHA